jgi:hypothetical protein
MTDSKKLEEITRYIANSHSFQKGRMFNSPRYTTEEKVEQRILKDIYKIIKAG